MLTLRKIFFNAASNYVRFFFDILIWFFLTPFVISCLGKNDFGILTLINSLLGAIGLLNMGIGTGVVKYVAGAVNKEVRETNRIVSTFLGIYLFLSLIALLIMLVGCFFIGDFFAIPAERNTLFLQVFWIMGCRMVILYLPLHLFYGILYGRQRITLLNMTKLISELFYAGFCWFLLSGGHGLLSLAVLGLCLMLFEHIIYIMVCYKTVPGLRISLSYFDRFFFREALPFSLHAFVINVSNFVLLKSDPILVKLFFPLSSVSIYGIALKLSESSLLMFKQFINVLTPVVAEMHGSGDSQGVVRVFLKGARYAIMPAMLLWIGFMVHGETFLVWWLGEPFRASAPVLLILSGAVVLIMPQLSASNALAMSGHHQIVSKASLFALVLNIVASLCFLQLCGINGVALGSLFAVLVVDIGFILRRALQVFSISVRQLIKEVFLPVVVAGLPAYLTLFAVTDHWPVTDFIGIILVSWPGVLVFFLVWALFLQKEEWRIIHDGWQRIRQR
jgi:O-antigen/teichoic acid export membrane protein